MSTNILNKMKITKYILFIASIILSSCSEEINRPKYQDDELGQYVRFALILDNNGSPIVDELGNGDQYVNTYHHEVFDTILIPVSMTSTSLTEEVEVTFSSTFYGDDAHTVHYSPDSVLTFGPDALYDTIELSFSERWFTDVKDSILLKIERTSNPNISIGYPFNDSINDELTIHLDAINLPITIRKPNEFEITDPNDLDTFDIYLDFENGFIFNELENTTLLNENENTLDYTLKQYPFQDGDTYIHYAYIQNTPIANKFEDYSSTFSLAEIQGYTPWGRQTASVSYTGLEPYSYTLADDEIRIDGELNENVELHIVFSSPITESIITDLEDKTFLVATSSDFDYTLTQLPFGVDDDTITYIMELNESLVEDASTKYTTTFALEDIEGFTKYGNTEIAVIKEQFNDGDNSVNPASIFYNFTNPTGYQQLWCHMWISYSDKCQWRETFQLCYPVEVSEDHPNAVLHSNGKYYHAFRFGFNSPNAGRTVNSFGLKYLFDNEYTDEDLSPGFNIPEALELFPTDGNSRLGGNVAVIEQDLTISSRNGESFTMSIAGEGSYYYDEGSYELYADSIFTIELNLELTSDELFGGSRVVEYRFKNRDLDNTEKPEYEPDGCFPVIDLNTIN